MRHKLTNKERAEGIRKALHNPKTPVQFIRPLVRELLRLDRDADKKYWNAWADQVLRKAN